MTRTEALAAALHRIHPGPRPWPGGLTDDEMADHILAALDGYELVPKGLMKALGTYFRAVDAIRDAGEARGGDPMLITAVLYREQQRKRRAEDALRAAIKEANHE